MLSNKRHTEPWKSTVKFIGRCPVCNTEYPAESARFIAEQETGRLLHITCTHCNSYFIALVIIAGQGLSSVGMITDLSYEDAVRCHHFPAVSLDEVIDFHQFLQNNVIQI